MGYEGSRISVIISDVFRAVGILEQGQNQVNFSGTTMVS
jgi:hypothetical protein